MKFVFLFFIFASMSLRSMTAAAAWCANNTTGGATCTFLPQTTIVVESSLGLTITNEELYEATFNELDNKFDDLPMSFTVSSTTDESILYSLTVEKSEHGCNEVSGGSVVGDTTPIVVGLSIDGDNVNVDDVWIAAGADAVLSRDHELKIHFGNDHQMRSAEQRCSGEVVIQAGLRM